MVRIVSIGACYEVLFLRILLLLAGKVEKIEDSEAKFTCENCKEEVSLEKQLMLDQAPSVAAFHLKRFKNYGSYVEKLTSMWSFHWS